MFDALEISKDILVSQPIIFGGSNGTRIWNSRSQHRYFHLLMVQMNLSLHLENKQHGNYGWIRLVHNQFLQYNLDIDNIVPHNV